MMQKNKPKESSTKLRTGTKVALALLLIGAILFIASVAIWCGGNVKAGIATMWASAIPLGIGLVVQMFSNIDDPNRDLHDLR